MRKKPIYTILPFLLLLLVLAGCTSIRPVDSGLKPELVVEAFKYDDLARLLKMHVNEQGLVDYEGLAENPTDLDHFYKKLATFSPDSHPELFPTESDRLAYWINGYNATVLKGVITYYPITTVADVKPPTALFFFPDKSGFFFFQRFTYGKVETNLYYLENKIIRVRFQDPRFHFALNCASSSCPELPREPYLPEQLDSQLDREARSFINDKDNVRFDPSENILYLSSIFKWYEEDFVGWLGENHPIGHPTLRDYVLLYLAEPARGTLAARPEPPSLEFLPYDWGLNDATKR